MKFLGLNFRRNNIVLPDANESYAITQQYNLPGLLARSNYDNGFAFISAIADEIIQRNIRLGAANNPDVDVTNQYPFWDAFIQPNQTTGFIQFIDMLVAGFLSQSEITLLLWHPTSNGVQPGRPSQGWKYNNIAGFTVLPNKCKQHDYEGRPYWQLPGTSEKYTSDDVLTLKYSLFPEDGITGMSPGSASAQESSIQDRLNQSLRATFDNGAAPSLMVTIYARTNEEYDAIQKAYEKKNRGAAQAGGVVYNKVIDQPIAGMSQPRVEVTPVGMPNKDLAITEIYDYTDKRLIRNYGVSPIITGDATTTTFQNQELAKSEFMSRVSAVMTRLFAGIEQELSRLFNVTPLPFVFVWDDVKLELTEQQKLMAETKTETVRAFLALTKSGVSPRQAQQVLGLDDEWAKIVFPEPPTVEPASTPEPISEPTVNNVKIVKCDCQHHNSLERVSDIEQTKQDALVVTLKNLAKEIFDGTVKNDVEDWETKAVSELLTIMESGAYDNGQILLNEIGQPTLIADMAALSETSRNKLTKRARRVIRNYVAFVTKKLEQLSEQERETFEKFFEEQIRSKAKTIGQQETKFAYQTGEMSAAQNIESWLQLNQPLSTIVKTWKVTSTNPCEFCVVMNGRRVGIQDSFVPGGLIDADGVTIVLDTSYSDGTTPDAHVNCQCVYEFTIVSE